MYSKSGCYAKKWKNLLFYSLHSQNVIFIFPPFYLTVYYHLMYKFSLATVLFIFSPPFTDFNDTHLKSKQKVFIKRPWYFPEIVYLAMCNNSCVSPHWWFLLVCYSDDMAHDSFTWITVVILLVVINSIRIKWWHDHIGFGVYNKSVQIQAFLTVFEPWLMKFFCVATL